jgi:integrase/recombinase XerD
MAQSLIPFPSTTHPNVPISRRWIAFRVIHTAGGPSWAVVDATTYELHREVSAYLHYLLGSARSTNTIRTYAQRLAAFFTCRCWNMDSWPCPMRNGQGHSPA